jgi:hypothetical protein
VETVRRNGMPPGDTAAHPPDIVVAEKHRPLGDHRTQVLHDSPQRAFPLLPVAPGEEDPRQARRSGRVARDPTCQSLGVVVTQVRGGAEPARHVRGLRSARLLLLVRCLLPRALVRYQVVARQRHDRFLAQGGPPRLPPRRLSARLPVRFAGVLLRTLEIGTQSQRARPLGSPTVETEWSLTGRRRRGRTIQRRVSSHQHRRSSARFPYMVRGRSSGFDQMGVVVRGGGYF